MEVHVDRHKNEVLLEHIEALGPSPHLAVAPRGLVHPRAGACDAWLGRFLGQLGVEVCAEDMDAALGIRRVGRVQHLCFVNGVG